jgi:hypothetical protein
LDKEYIERLAVFLQSMYGVDAISIVPAKRGFFGETWCVHANTGDYFVKIDFWDYHKELYRKSFAIIDYLGRNGISDILKIRKTLQGELYSMFDQGVLGLFDFVEGENTEEYPSEMLFSRLASIYKLTGEGLPIERERFGTDIVETFRGMLACLESSVTESARRIRGSVTMHAERIAHCERRLSLFSDRCRHNLADFHITHGDAGGNCILDGDNMTIVDWDAPLMAPIERDAWFYMREPNLIETFNHVLQSNGIHYALDSNRLCYYAYFSFFYYLTEYIKAYRFIEIENKRAILAEDMAESFDSWVMRVLDVADTFS